MIKQDDLAAEFSRVIAADLRQDLWHGLAAMVRWLRPEAPKTSDATPRAFKKSQSTCAEQKGIVTDDEQSHRRR